MIKLFTATAVALTLAAYGMAEAKTFRFSSSGDINGLDPHVNNEAPTNAMKNNIYETLIFRDYNLKLVPGLATEWKQTDPTTWRFTLRDGVSRTVPRSSRTTARASSRGSPEAASSNRSKTRRAAT